MSDIFVARQPIFTRNKRLFGYELLYRRSQNNFFEGDDDDQATAALLDNSFFFGFTELIDSTRGFINFSSNLLLNQVPLMLPHDKVIVEILERVEITDEVVDACRRLKTKGYTLALDDFIFGEEKKSYAPLLDIIDIIKVEYSQDTIKQQHKLIKKYGSRIVFLAERIETQQDFQIAKEIGYKLFQGYFFSKPIMINSKQIGSLADNLMLILSQLNKPEPDIKGIAKVIEGDVELSYKLLRRANSSYYGATQQISSIQQAIVQIGINELRALVQLLLIKGIQNAENAELVKASLIRGKLMALIAINTGKMDIESDYFIAGIFSSIDVLLGQEIETIVAKLPLSDTVSDALLGSDNELRKLIDAIIEFERMDLQPIDTMLRDIGINKEKFMALYIEALQWQQALD